MSYAYIKSVYPNFSQENTLQTKLFNSLDTMQVQQKTSDPVVTARPVSAVTRPTTSVVPSALPYVETQERVLPANKLVEEYSPMPVKQYKQQYQYKEKFEEDTKSESTCHKTITHVLHCDVCRSMLSKQLNIEYDKVRNEEMIELFSYLTFGVFVLLLLDNLKQK